jgi:hypothetical protein
LTAGGPLFCSSWKAFAVAFVLCSSAKARFQYPAVDHSVPPPFRDVGCYLIYWE